MKKSKGKKETPREFERRIKRKLKELAEERKREKLKEKSFEEVFGDLAQLTKQMSERARWGEEPRSWTDRLKFFNAYIVPYLVFFIVAISFVQASGIFIGRFFNISSDVIWNYTETVSIGVVSSIIAHFALQFSPWGGFSKREGAKLFGEVGRLFKVMVDLFQEVLELKKEQAKVSKKLKKEK